VDSRVDAKHVPARTHPELEQLPAVRRCLP
jgi:hypothetical protein